MKELTKLQTNKQFTSKNLSTQSLILTTLRILKAFGIPLSGTPRRLERMAMAFLACGNVKHIDDLLDIADSTTPYTLKTRDIIHFLNTNFEEQISRGSYDDIRRKDLRLLTTAGIVLQSNPNAATNDSTRGYCINPVYAALVRKYQAPNWATTVSEQLGDTVALSDKLKRKRKLEMIEVMLPAGKQLSFSVGKHNVLQQQIIEVFLPRFGHGAEVLYVGDTADKFLHLDRDKFEKLQIRQLAHEELPDVVAYSSSKNWLYLVEAVHSSGPIDEIRLLRLQELTKDCTAAVIFVTAFLDRAKFRQYASQIAWETEVWIADNPDHMIHFNGDKFFGPYVE